MKIATGIS